MKLYLCNPERKQWKSGWGVINRGLFPLENAERDSADVHLYASPPYSYKPLVPGKFNVGICMSEWDDLRKHYPRWDFVGLCNAMDLLIVPGPWQEQVLKINGIKTPIRQVLLGHFHEQWRAPLQPGANRRALIIDRGRDHAGGLGLLANYFEQVELLDIRTPSKKTAETLQSGRLPDEELQREYRLADVFFKWSREGWCYPILEAMSAGCLVLTNCHTLPYLEPGKNCLTFGNVDELKDRLERASRNNLDLIKQAGQKTAASLTWEAARKGIRDAILERL